jgi:hypothetical protein
MNGEPRQRLDALLAAFGEETGLKGLATEENGVCILVFDGRLHINLLADPNTDQLLAWSNLGEIPADRVEPTLRKLMQANLFWNGTDGATLGLMPDANDIVLAIRRPMASVDLAGLRDVIELMLNRVQALGPVVAGATPPAALGTAAAPIGHAAIRG